MSNVKYRAITIAAVILICIYGIIGLPTSMQELSDNLKKSVRLGLDLKGGSQLMLQVQLQDAFKGEADAAIQRLKDELAKINLNGAEMSRNDPQSLKEANSIEVDVKGIPATQAAQFRQLFTENFSNAWILTPVNQTDYRMTMQASYALKLRGDTLTQSINTIEKKINGLGLTESTVQQRGGASSEAEILVQLPGVDDPAHVKQILQAQAVLELREVKTDKVFGSREEAVASKGGV